MGFVAVRSTSAKRLLAAAMVIGGLAVVVSSAVGAGGTLTPVGGCIADIAHNAGGCGDTAKGLWNADSVAVSADGKSVYATGTASSAIVSFKRNPPSGALTPIGCIADSANNAAGCARTAKGLLHALSVTVSPDGRSVYVAAIDAGAIVMFRRNTISGALTPLGCIADPTHNPGCARTAKGLRGAESVAVSPDGKSVYVAAYGAGDGAVVALKRNLRNGVLSSIGCIATPGHNPAGCSKTAKGLRGAWFVSVSADGNSVYAASGSNFGSALVTFKRNPTSGGLTPLGCIGDVGHNPGCAKVAIGLGFADWIAVSADGKSLYAAGSSDNAIVRFRRNPLSGALTPVGCVAALGQNPAGCGKTAKGLAGVRTVAISPDGGSVYAASLDDSTVVSFRRDSRRGRLTFLGCIADTNHNTAGCGRTTEGLGGAVSLAVSADGKSLYSVAGGDSAIVAFRRAAP